MKKRIACLLLALLLVLPGTVLASRDGSRPWEGPGYASPEEAVAAYLAGLRDGDLYGILRAFAWEPVLEHETLRASLETGGVYQLESWPMFPDGGGFLRQLNESALLQNRLTGLMQSLYMYSTGAEDSMEPMKTFPVREEADADAIAAAFDLEQMRELGSLGNVRILPAERIAPEQYGKERLQKQMDTNRIRIGADELCDMAAVFTIGSGMYGVAPRLARYGDSWYIVSLSSLLAYYIGAETVFYALFPFSGKAAAMLADLPEGAGAAVLPERQDTGTEFAVPWESSGYDTPEAAVRAYLEGLGTGDLDAMLKAFAWGPMAEHATLQSVALRNRAYTARNWPAFPDDGGLLAQINRLMLIGRWASPIRFSIRNFLVGKDLEQYPDWMKMSTLSFREEGEREAFLALFEKSGRDLSTLEIAQIGTPETLGDAASAYYSESAQKALEQYREAYGADEMGDMAAVFTVDGERYGFFPQVVRYGGRWYLGTEMGVLCAVLGIATNESAIAPF